MSNLKTLRSEVQKRLNETIQLSVTYYYPEAGRVTESQFWELQVRMDAYREFLELIDDVDERRL